MRKLTLTRIPSQFGRQVLSFALGLAIVSGTVAPGFAQDEPKAPKKAEKPKAPPEKLTDKKSEDLADEDIRDLVMKLNKIGDLEEADAKLKELIKTPDLAKRMAKYGAKLQKDGGEKAPLKFYSSIVLAKAAANAKDYASAEGLYEWNFERGIKAGNRDQVAIAFDGLVRIYTEQKRFASIEDLAKRLIDGENGVRGLQFTALEKLIQAKARQGDIEEALRLTDVILQRADGDWQILQLKAWVLREAKRYTDSIDVYNEIIAKIKDTDDLAEGARARLIRNAKYLISSIHVDNKDVDNAVKVLRGIIKDLPADEPGSATYYNDLGFILADANKNMDEAESLIRKALDLDAKERANLLKKGDISEEAAKEENSAYLDSLGWVLFKNKKYEEALKYLEKAAKDPEDGNHIEIFDHVADCQMALGRKADAIATWEKALKLEDVSPRDVERRKNVRAKLKAAKEAAGDKPATKPAVKPAAK